jgi:hypothetical protein
MQLVIGLGCEYLHLTAVLVSVEECTLYAQNVLQCVPHAAVYRHAPYACIPVIDVHTVHLYKLSAGIALLLSTTQHAQQRKQQPPTSRTLPA